MHKATGKGVMEIYRIQHSVTHTILWTAESEAVNAGITEFPLLRWRGLDS